MYVLKQSNLPDYIYVSDTFGNPIDRSMEVTLTGGQISEKAEPITNLRLGKQHWECFDELANYPEERGHTRGKDSSKLFIFENTRKTFSKKVPSIEAL
jgi:hypothetical protein